MKLEVKILVRNSIVDFEAADESKQKAWIQHIQSLLKWHERGLESIGVGYSEDFVEAGRVFLRIYREKYCNEDETEGVGSDRGRPV